MTQIMNVNGKFTDIISYVKNILFLMVLMAFGATSVWAQETGYSGTYLIKSVSANKKTAGDYYICPTEGWIYYTETNSFTETDNGQPFLTTYQCKSEGYDVRKALWKIEKSGDYYTIKHVIDGKYMVYNGKISDAADGRIRIHLADVDTPGDNEKFVIGTNKNGKIAISPKGVTNYFNVCQGNINSLAGSTEFNKKAKNDGPTKPTNHKTDIHGTIGLWSDINDENAPFELEVAEVCETPTITYNESNGEVSMSTATDGATIYYTLDGSEPTSSNTSYNGTFTVSATANIKAIAVKDNMYNSMTASKQVMKYTYYIVNSSNNIAVQHTIPYPVSPGEALNSYASIPTEIQSPYIYNETITFYSWKDGFDADSIGTEHLITKTPSNSDKIYVKYSTDKLNEKYLHLQMARPMNIKHEESSTYKYIYNNSGTVTYDASAEASITDSKYLWYIGNSTNPDPYNVLVKNSTKTSNLKYASSTLSLTAEDTYYFITDTTKVDDNNYITLKNISTGELFTIMVNEVEIPTSYYLIDKAGKDLFGPKESTSSTMEIPSEWYSPVVGKNGYHYWRSSSFDRDGTTYTLKEDQTELNGLAELGTGEHIFITYDVDNESLDLDGRNILNDPLKTGGKTYMLEFYNGEKFKQEDGSDGVMTETRKAVYPYSNGDAALYVYGNERWEEQLASGASTRTRWLWYIEPAKGVLDPYHVKISSYQTQTSYKIDDDNTRNFHSYLKTYQPEGYNAIVTGVTNNNPLVKGKAKDAEADNSDATEYMILGSSMTDLKLVTVEAIPLDLNGDDDTNDEGESNERRTVNSFEQYWKNNPTVQDTLTNKVTKAGRNVTLEAAQKTEIAGLGWHVYKTWANSQPWMHNNDEGHTTSKKFENEEHVFQTVSMGTGSFHFVKTEIKPMLILLDQHGWEIVRLQLPSGPDDPNRAARYAELHKYSSPMVERYHFWKTGSKVPGYHKFTVSDYATKADGVTEYTADELGRVNINNPLTPPNLPNYATQALVGGKERDWYVTYDVKAEYANAYTAAAEEGETAAVPYLIKQNGSYAQYSGSGNTLSSTTTEPDITNVPAGMQWYIKPNFDIDKEMGYLYDGEIGAEEDAGSKSENESAYFAAGKNGFDPYNVQIKSAVPNTDRYFTADTENSIVTSLWAGTSSAITLENMTQTTRQPGIIGLDQTKMKITNATFMVIDDGNGNMTLMPRFDNTKVMQTFTTLATPSGAATQSFTLTQVPQVVNSSDDIKVMGGKYLLSNSFSASGSIGTKDAPFIGTIEGQIGHSFDISAPLIAYADGAVIKNVIIENASISSGDTIGAIVATASGATRIYNCGVNGGSVSGSVYAGGIVGFLDGSSRVINCYSYADVGGGTGGGIVGYNNFASDSTDIRTMVMNCMFYGNMTCSNKAPIYNGKIISNKDASGLGNYNYFLADRPYVKNNQINTYNCALMAETRFLQRFEFYRLLLNSHLELAGWYATGEYKKDEMMKWVLETADRTITNPKPYPVLKTPGKYPSIINIDAENAPTTGDRNTGKELGTLSVSIQMGTNSPFAAPEGATITDDNLSLPITDKDFERFNFNYRKVQLPYYNDVGTKNYTGNRVVTGWKIVSISGGTAGSFTTGDDAPAYNFADRNCTNKDKYDVSGRVFNQGAYWDVPEGVTGITIEPYWAHAVYLADAYTDVVYNQEMGTPYIVTAAGGQIYKNGSKYDIAGDNDQKVYTNVKDAREKLETNKTVYDCAIVLVGNFHNIGVSSTEGSRSYTIMSADFDHDNEPDYSYILRFDNRNQTHPVRVDFVNIPGLGMAQKSTGGKGTYNFGIMQPIGWFESTNTSLFRVTQLEYDRDNRGEAPIIVQGGVMEQWVSGQSNKVANKTTYFHVGGNAWFKEFHRGTHQDQTYTSKHPPVSVTGGDYDEFYLTGLYRGDVDSYADNAECYINGGRFGVLAGAAQEGIGKANGADNTGNITWQIQNADIREFYGGGFNAAKPVTGNISTTITGSHVTTFCGGPKFGDMSAGKTVTTNATDCTFGTYFGAGYGGNSYSRQAPRNHNNLYNFPHNDNQAGNHASWNAWLEAYYKQAYNATYGGVSTQFSYQFLPMSGNKDNVARIFVEYVKFSLATTRNVTSTLTGCTVTGNFYGGGSLGKVDGNVTSTLNGCTVKGNVFGAGFSASLPPVEVDSLGFRTEPHYYDQAGTFAAGVKGATTTYHWQHGNAISIDKDNKILYTTEDLTGLGAVTGTVTLTVDGNTVVGDDANENSGNVYGGGESSDATSDVNVHILNGTMTDVYGGGKGQKTVVGGDVTVNIGAKSGEGALSGNGTVNGNVYGGSALGVVNATSTKDGNGDITAYTPTPNKTSHVNIYKGTVTGSVFGGGLGQLASAEPVQAAIAAQNFGNAIISMEGGSVGDAIYGGANANGVLKADAEVTLLGGTIGDSENASRDVVFGGGKGEPTLVNGSILVNVGTKSDDPTPVHAGTAMIFGNVYGGSALGHTNATSNVDFNTSATTNVNLYSGTINGYVFGGGLGRKYKAAVAQQGTEGQPGYVPAQSEVTAVESFVGGDVTVLLDGAKVRQVFGCNNLNGTPKGHVLVHVMLTNNFSGNNDYKNNSETALDARTTYDVEAVYGGGNKADYNPTKATDPDENVKKQAFAEVLIEGCDSTSIEYVYGGGNAAAVPADSITVKSVYIIGQLFGGGNGAGADNPGADVGVIDRDAYAADKSTGIYGTGIAKTKLIGGQIRYVYGGSNTKGNVRGGTSLERKESNACALKIKEIYGAGQLAPMDGDVIIKLDCMPKDFVSQVFGGAKNATINGKVSLTVSSGKFGRVFGGNNLGGSINGSIEVNAYEDGCKPLIIGELYGGGFNAPYSIWGCNDSDNDGTWTPNTPAGDPHVKADTIAVSVNVYSCTSIGKVFGGGFGATANVVGNTHVWINTMQGLVNGIEQTYGEGVYIGKIGQVFGGGNAAPVKGDVTIDIGTATVSKGEKIGIRIINGTDYLKTTTDADTTITAGIYGGGNAADVDGNVTMNIGTVSQNQGINIGGDIYGGGYGETTHVTGNVTVNIGKKESETPVGYANITGDVYGGSAKGTVNSADNVNATTDSYTKVNFYGGAITGNIYGGGEGQRAAAATGEPGDPGYVPAQDEIAANVFGPVTVTTFGGSVYNVFGCNNFYGTPKDTVAVIINGGTVNNSVYGGGNQAEYTAPEGKKNYPAVYINNGTITEDVFGGGFGLSAVVTGNPHVTIGDNVEGHTVTILESVYGGGELAGVNGNTNIVVNSGTIGTEGEGGATYGNIYGGGFGSEDNVRIGIVTGNTNITVNGGNVLHNIYGGGALASVGTYTYASEAANAAISGHTENTGKATITILGGTVGTDGHNNGMVFGSSRGDIDAPEEIHDNLAWVFDTDVTIGTNGSKTGPTINGSLYGGGENGHVYNDAKVTMYSGTVGNMDEYYSYRGNVYGGGCGTDLYYSDPSSITGTHTAHDGEGDKYNPIAGIVRRNATVIINGGNIANNVYGAGSMGKVGGNTYVTINTTGAIGVDGSHDDGNVYGAARGELNLTGKIPAGDKPEDYSYVTNSSVTISKGTVRGSVFGGGKAGVVKGNVNVLVKGGKVINDVYGGGALANTNTDNWDFTTPTSIYLEMSNLTFPSYSEKTTVKTGDVVTGLYTRSGDSEPYTYTLIPKTEPETTAVAETKYYERHPGSSVDGLYTKLEEVYSPAAGEAVKGTKYYEKRDLPGTWAEDKSSDSNTTTVTLIGGVIGNAYGGGLGDSTHPVYVCGDVLVSVNDPDTIDVNPGVTGVGFTSRTKNDVTIDGDDNNYVVTLTGRVFGCNNIKGTPLGDVNVKVFSTRTLNASGEVIPHEDKNSHKPYEIQAVYGGGNQADYVPASGKGTHVLIDGCNETTIKKVYGGGSSASVPATDVLIKASLDIGFAFGGGNGGEKVYDYVSGKWKNNDGASVNGLAKITCQGGKIGQVFGGSDNKGNCRSTSVTKSESGSCPLVITRMYGAGNEADVTGDVNIVVSGCTASNSEIEYICGGSYNAHVTGSVTLTITSGFFNSVYGGNEATGSIGGNITVNIEETDDCKPIIIGNLVGGGNMAPYPGTLRNGTPITKPGNITVNVKSATRIGNIYGGGYESEVLGNTTVNINMIKGHWAGKTYDPSGTAMAIPDSVGVIGNVYGGGNEGRVRGNSTVNIGTLRTIQIMKRNAEGKLVDGDDHEIYDAEGNFNEGMSINSIVMVDTTVVGARITGDVFGGGNMADVTGDATVNICTADYSASSSVFKGVSIGGSVYGGGSAADVLGNTFVSMSDGKVEGGAYVYDGVYGGGLMGSVGTVTERDALPAGHSSHEGCLGGKPKTFAANTGKCTVVISGGQVGPVEVATQGMTKTGGPVDVGFVFGAGRGEVEDPAVDKDADFHTFVNTTEVIIKNKYAAGKESVADSLSYVVSKPIIMASVYGGGENGRVLDSTYVKIYGGQIGCGKDRTKVVGVKTLPKLYEESQFIDPTTTAVTDANALPECRSWEFVATDYKSYDPMTDKPYSDGSTVKDASKTATDGNTYYGSVFGGGSGYYPYAKANGRHDWLRSAGAVYGNTRIDITGGHILNSVYGGNETTDVSGKSTINMSGGTVGVPRTIDQIATRPISCCLFGAGKGDHRTHFNTWTNINETEVNVSGGIVYGSVFGGGEEGHVLGDVKMNISGTAKIGTHGTTQNEGNVYGIGRGYSGVALTAGSTGGNVTMGIGGTAKILGSVYGGGRMSSVGIVFTGPEDLYYGQLKDDTDSKTYGHVTIDISGSTIIGNKTTLPADVDGKSDRQYSGNVYGGSKGRITFLNGKRNPIWPKQAVAKLSNITIRGGEITNNVYGGGEIGIVRNRATITISGGTIDGNVFGGGYGSDEQDTTTIAAGGYGEDAIYYTFTPMMWTGCVSGDTYVNISGGAIKKNVYGGGNYASVGLMNYNSRKVGDTYEYKYVTKHESLTNGFGLSWPYEFKYIKAAPTDIHAPGGNAIGGKTTVSINGGTIGTLDNESKLVAGTGNVYGGSKGMVTLKKENNVDFITDVNEQRYAEAFCANVRETAVTIGETGTPTIHGSVYGGSQDGHVIGNANVTITKGLIGLSVYGGGQGESTFMGKLKDPSTGNLKATTEEVHSITAGKVYGNTSVSMTGGTVVGHVYGGGNLASVGKGNYAGGADDYYPAGYGETLTGNLWTPSAGFNPNAPITDSNKPTTFADHFLSSGHVTVSITGGTIGTLNGTSGTVFGTSEVTPTGLVFGGSRGRAAEDVMLDPRHEYAPDFYLGYVNTTKVTIGNADGGPRIFSQVFGGGRDGHVRDSSYVIINKGIIGQTYSETTDDYQRYHRGNVYGSGSGLGQWATGKHGMASGSVTNKTRVDINGGTIYNNVYGGGALSSVGPPRLDSTKDYAAATISQCVVNINGGTIGQTADYESYKYGGCVYGASRGNDFEEGESEVNFATVLWTKVNINGGDIAGNVYGGAKGGLVWKDTEVHLKGGVIAHNAYGGGQGTSTIPANIGGNTTVKLNEGKGASDSGCIVEKVFGCNDLNGTPKGHALVHVYATQHKGKTKIVPDGGKYAKFGNVVEDYSITNYSGLTTLAEATGTNVTAYTDILSGSGTTDEKNNALADMMEAIADDKYDVLAVYGGGDLAPYEPTNPNETTDVIIDGCDLTSIKQVYGGGNAASTPANQVRINEAYEIHEAFGGGNGKDDYEIDGKYYKNLGANIGYKATFYSDKTDPEKGTKVNPYPAVAYADADTPEERRANTSYHYGKGTAHLIITGGRVHSTYGGSNMKGNVRAEAVTSTEDAGDCTMLIDVSTAAGKNADTDGGARLDSRCVDYQAAIYGGSTDANVYNDVVINITNGTYGKIFGGNNLSGKIYGSITINVREEGCKPIVIDSLFAGGNKADYSIYGFNDDGSARTKAQYDVLSPEEQAKVLQRNPQINIISATRIGTIYGGAYKAKVIGNPSVNVNMEEGFVAAKYATAAKYNVGYHELSEHDMDCSYHVLDKDDEGKAILKIGTIGTIFGGGSLGDIYGDTRVDIGTGKHFNFAGEEEVITPARNAAFILGKVVAGKYVGGQVYGGGDQGYVFGNSTVNIANGYIYDRVYGGGKEGTVGTVTSRAALPEGHTAHGGCLGGKPAAFETGTGRTAVTVSGGYVGPFTYERSASTRVATPKPMTMPEDYGYVFAAGRGKMGNPATAGNEDIEFMTYVDSTEVIISDSALIAGGVYGGSENGRVLRNTHVNIRGGQIGLGAGQTTAYDESAFIDPMKTTVTDVNKLAECAAWPYGIDTNDDEKKDTWLPYDEHAGDAKYDTENYGAASTTGSDGHTFYGNVFGGGSGYFAYQIGETGVYEWLPSAGLVEGDTYVNISGGHILTNVYGGNEMTNVTGTAHVTMTGGTLGVPRTLARIAEHPVTCYLFGAGKGDQRVHFNKSTNVGHAVVNVSGGIIYGSVFGGGEDGHVLGDVTMNISDGAKIGTWGTSYVDGNVFGGGRGFGGDAYTAGNVAGSVTLNITGGTMLGSVYGGGRLGSVGYGLFSKNEVGYGTMRDDGVTEEGFVPPGGLTKRGHVVVNISGDNTVIGNKYEYQNVPTDVADLDTWKTANHVPQTAYETTTKTVDATTQYIHRLKHTRGGNVFAGGMGRYTLLDGTPISTYDGSGNLTSPIEWKKLGNVKSTKLTISGNPWIMGNVYGGGEFGAVQGSHQRYDGETPLVDASDNPVVASTEILFTGGTIGTEITTADPQKETKETTASRSIVQYTFGSIYGGGMGQETHDDADNHGGDVKDSTYISMSSAASLVRASVYGGGEMAIVEGNTRVNISNGKIGRNEVVMPLSDPDAGYVLFGGATMGNVYGGGKGILGHTKAGQVKGNTNVTISGGNVYHNIYGGGALGSVGDFKVSDGAGHPSFIPYAGVPYGWDTEADGETSNGKSTGIATVTITGGTIGISGRDNGLVFGSSRGGLKAPEDGVDPYDRVAWVNKSVVNIGTEGSGSVYTTPLIKGSVYGGGENGHNADSAKVNIYSGTIGVVDKLPDTETADPWWDFGNEDKNTLYRGNRGNVYGAGSGADTYTGNDGKEYYNPKAGMVGHNTEVNIYGGHVGRNVYGGGSIAMVGTITNVNDTTAVDKGGTGTARHTSETTSFALSWPYKFVFKENTGKATVNITGGHIGTLNTDGGDVFGSSRGVAGDRYTTAHLAYVKETEVNVSYPAPVSIAPATTVYEYYASLMPTIKTNFDIPCITGSVSGSGENGYVYGDTHVTLNKGLIGHSLYGGGKGKGTYTKALNKIGGGGTYNAKIYSLIAGKVMGNTYVTMNDGYVGRNVYGGGNMASVGKGSYAGGADDYYPAGYGETLNENITDADKTLWDGGNANSIAFLSSGKTTVNVISGNVGYIDKSKPENSMKNELPYGNVIGGSAGEAAPNLPADLLKDRYLYSPAFYSGYVNETDVTIGGYRCKTAYTGHAVGELITANDFKDVAVGDTAKWQLVGPTIIANVYGGGQDGHVRRDTKVTVLSGEIGRPYNSDNVAILGNLQLGDGSLNPQWLHRGNVYGGGSGITQYTSTLQYKDDTPPTTGYSSSSGSVSRFTEVNVLGGIVHRNVYGGGSLGSVGAPDLGQGYDPDKKDLSVGNKANWGKQSQCTVNISGQIGTVISSRSHYGGDVFGACRGNTSLNANEFGTAVWTRVNILDGATIFGNVFGGGDAGIVRKNAEVIIGGNAE